MSKQFLWMITNLQSPVHFFVPPILSLKFHWCPSINNLSCILHSAIPDFQMSSSHFYGLPFESHIPLHVEKSSQFGFFSLGEILKTRQIAFDCFSRYNFEWLEIDFTTCLVTWKIEFCNFEVNWRYKLIQLYHFIWDMMEINHLWQSYGANLQFSFASFLFRSCTLLTSSYGWKFDIMIYLLVVVILSFAKVPLIYHKSFIAIYA